MIAHHALLFYNENNMIFARLEIDLQHGAYTLYEGEKETGAYTCTCKQQYKDLRSLFKRVGIKEMFEKIL